MIRPLIPTLAFLAITLVFTNAEPTKIVATDIVVLAIPVADASGLTHASALEKFANGEAELVAQASLTTNIGQRAKIEFHRGHRFAKTMKRRGETAALPRRSAIEHVGTTLEVDPLRRADGKTIDLSLDLITHVADPKTPALADRLAAMKKEEGTEQEVPEPKFSEVVSNQKIEAINEGQLSIAYLAPPKGLAPGKIYAVLIRARLH